MTEDERDREALRQLGRAYKAAREGKGLSQDAVARAAGVSPATVRKIEKAEANPQFLTLVRVAAGMGMSMKTLAEPIQRRRKRGSTASAAT